LYRGRGDGIVKKVREGYKITELGEIPVNWSISSLGVLTEIVRGASPRPKGDPRYYGGSIPRLMISDVTRDGKYVTPRKDFLTEDGAKKSRPMKKGDLVISISGTVALPTFLAVDSCIHDGFMGFKKLDENLNKDFLYYQILFLREKLIGCATDGGVYVNLTTDIVKGFNILLPTYFEQQKISLILSTVDEKIETTDELIEKTKELKKGLMQRLLTKGIGHDRFKDTEIGTIPEEWEVGKIKDLSSFCSNGFVGTASPFYTKDNEGTPYLMSNNVRANKIDERTLVKISKEFKQQYPRSTIYEGDMLTVQSGHIGTSCVVPERYNNTNCHALIITRFNKDKIDPLFISYYINSSSGLSRLSNIFVGTTIKHVNVKDLIQFYVPVPPLKEQKQIALILSSVDDRIDQYDVEKQKLQELKKGLMQKLLTGKIRVKV
jgi:type I restriction enzyme S subunit